MKSFKLVCVIIILIIIQVNVLANIIKVQVTGVVDSLSENGGFALDGSITAGSVMTGIITYDSQAPNIAPSHLSNEIYEIISVTMQIGNYQFSSILSQDAPLFTTFYTDPGYLIIVETARFEGAFFDNGNLRNFDDYEWAVSKLKPLDLLTGEENRDFITYGQIPTSYPDLDIFHRREFSLSFCELEGWETLTAGRFAIHGELISVSVIPEPTTVLLFGLGMIAIWRKRG